MLLIFLIVKEVVIKYSKEAKYFDILKMIDTFPSKLTELYAYFWVILRRLNFICRRFGTFCLFHLHRRVPAYEDGADRMFRNVGIQNSEHGESLKSRKLSQIGSFFSNCFN